MNQSAFCNNSVANSSASNFTCASTTSQPAFPPNSGSKAILLQVVFGSSIYMFVVSFITVVANSLLLLVVCADPYKTFRNPTSFFLVGLALVDLITGLVQEPIFASCFLLLYLGHPAAKTHCPQLIIYVEILAFVTMNASFFIVLAFTVTQLIVITSPLKYAPFVTKKLVIIAVLVIFAYTIIFGSLGLVQLPGSDTFKKLDLFLHSLFMVYTSIACYILLYRAFRLKMKSSKSVRSETNTVQRRGQSGSRVERKFVAINFLLIFLVFICTQPLAFYLVYHYFWASAEEQQNFIPRLILDDVLYLKFLMDPFIYAWRLPKYRRALQTLMRCGPKDEDRDSGSFASQTVVRMTKSTDTIVTLNFKSLADD